jgi:hypothetical protein
MRRDRSSGKLRFYGNMRQFSAQSNPVSSC